MKHLIYQFKKAHPVKQIVIIIWMLFFSIGIFSLFYFSQETLKSFILSLVGNELSLSSVLIFLSLFILRIIFFFPMSILMVISPFLFPNIFLAILFSGIGQIIGASFGFFLARYYGQELIEHKKSDMMKLINHKLENYGVISIVLLRLIPVFPYDLINFASGLSRIKFSSFFWATSLSVWSDCLIYVLAGSVLKNPHLLIFFFSLLLLISLFFWYMKNHPDYKEFFVMKIKDTIHISSRKK